MYIRRKVFSRLWDEETNEEKLFSVNETILSEEGIEDREFSKKDDEDDTKLKLHHRLNIAGYKMEGKLGRKLDKQNIEGDWKGTAKAGAALTAGSTLAGAGIGAALGGKRGAKVGAAMGAGLGAASGVGATLGTAAVKGLRKVSSRYDKAARQRLDEIKVAEGEMTKKEYKDKWYKKD